MYENIKEILPTKAQLIKKFEDLCKNHSMYVGKNQEEVDKIAAAYFSKAFPSKYKKMCPLKVSTNGNCLFASISKALIGSELLTECLRALSAIELYENADYYANSNIYSSENLFCQCLSDSGLSSYTDTKLRSSAIKSEAEYISQNFKWSSFISIMAASSVIKRDILVMYQDVGDSRMSNLFNRRIFPRIKEGSPDQVINLLWHRNDTTQRAGLQPNHFVPVVPCSIDRKTQSSNVLIPKSNNIKDLFQRKRKSESTEDYEKRNRPSSPVSKTISNAVVDPKDIVASSIITIEHAKVESKFRKDEESVKDQHFDKNDVGILVKRKLSNDKLKDHEKMSALSNIWKPTKNGPFNAAKNKRRFLIAWLTNHDWLAYSQLYDGAFCKFCVLFSDKVGQFITLPFKDWKNANKRFSQHELTYQHKVCTSTSVDFSNSITKPESSISSQLDSISRKNIAANREVLRSLIKILLMMARQDIALRGKNESGFIDQFQGKIFHNDSLDMQNYGNFLSLVKLAYELNCPVLKEHLSKCPKNATYLSKSIQNELLQYLSQDITEQVTMDIKTSVHFSILADEATDISNKTQMPLVIRYVDTSQKVKEKFVKMCECHHGCNAEGLTKTILGSIDELNLDMNFCVGQGYDGAGVMAGRRSGVSTRIRERYRNANYVHCSSHKLSLCICGSCQLPIIEDMMSQFQAIALFFYQSPVRCKVLEDVIKATSPEITHTIVKNICRTRWVEKLDGLKDFIDLMVCVMLTFEKIIENEDRSFSNNNRDASRPLLKGMKEFQFIAAVVIVNKILGYTRGLTVRLQNASLDLYKAEEDLQLLKDTLKTLRTNIDEKYEKWYEEILKLAEEMEVVEHFKRCSKKQMNRENYSVDNAKEYYKFAIAIPFLDHLNQELASRFSPETLVVYDGFYLVPTVMFCHDGQTDSDGEFKWRRKCLKFMSCYKDDMPLYHNVDSELDMWEQKWKTEKVMPVSLVALLEKTDRIIFPTIQRAIHILATIPVTTCSCERSVSGLRRVKTWLRSTMTEERLNALCVIMFNRDIVVNEDKVIDIFHSNNKRRMNFSNLFLIDEEA